MKELFWGYFIELSSHLDSDGNGKDALWYLPEKDMYTPEINTDFRLWDELVAEAAKNKYNALVIDVLDGVKYESHPEISAPDAVSKEFLKKKLDEARALGLTPIPKLNFSAVHAVWTKEYRRMISSKPYRKFCADIIDELCELFDKPSLFHLGMDEETSYDCAQWREAAIMRGENLMFEDLGIMFDACRKNGARPWIWADYEWSHHDTFEKRMPRDIMISNWFYGHFMNYHVGNFHYDSIKCYEILEKLGFDQIPACSTIAVNENPYETFIHCPKVISKEHLKGYLNVPWYYCQTDNEFLLRNNMLHFKKSREKAFGKRNDIR